jgi:hypothetical protein
MSQRTVSIDSYFSLPTNLAAEMRGWPEFVDGDGYTTKLKSEFEEVTTSLEEEDGGRLVYVRGMGEGTLFYRVLGCTLYSLACHSDDVWPRVMRWSGDAQGQPEQA